jgi:hypothetical protein
VRVAYAELPIGIGVHLPAGHVWRRLFDDLDTVLNSIQISPVEAAQSGDDDPVETSAASPTSSG